VDALWKLSPLRGVIASDLPPPRTALSQDISVIRSGIARAHWYHGFFAAQFLTHASLHM